MATTRQDGRGDALRAHALLLAWYRDMGVDHALDKTPIDWLSRGNDRPGATFDMSALEPESAPQQTATVARRPLPGADQPARGPERGPSTQPSFERSSTPARPLTAAAPDEATLAARQTAAGASSIEDLQSRLAAFDGCSLKATAKSLCFYRGAAKARVMVIGEAPGAEEDKQGKPFVGQTGALLDRMLAAIGLTEADVHITNIVYWRPPGNRTPTPQEALVCRPFLERQVELVQPEVVLVLGGPASTHILDKPEGIMRLRGKWRDIVIGSHTAKAIATLHPSYLLRSPAAKRMAWRDMLAIAVALNLKAVP
jgi:uracil-DNA glycosylase